MNKGFTLFEMIVYMALISTAVLSLFFAVSSLLALHADTARKADVELEMQTESYQNFVIQHDYQ